MNEEFNLDERVLCEDDTCIGLVGSDGKCKVCGRLYQGSAALPFGDDATVDPSDEDSAASNAEAGDGVSENETWDADERVLCSDDTCVGIIGAYGTCGTCGRPGGTRRDK